MLVVSLRVQRHALGAVLALGRLELVEDLPVGCQLLPKKALGVRDMVKLFAELVYIIAQVRVVVVGGLLFRVMCQLADRVELLLGLAVAFRHSTNRSEHAARDTSAGGDEAAYGSDPERIMEG